MKSGFLEAEHGASITTNAGGCIAHTHVNLIPRVEHCLTMFDGELQNLESASDLATLGPIADPYVLVGDGRSYRLYAGESVPSQLIRRKLAARLGREDWDWAAFPNHPRIEETLRLWEGAGEA
jgi:hypothetical protein